MMNNKFEYAAHKVCSLIDSKAFGILLDVPDKTYVKAYDAIQTPIEEVIGIDFRVTLRRGIISLDGIEI